MISSDINNIELDIRNSYNLCCSVNHYVKNGCAATIYKYKIESNKSKVSSEDFTVKFQSETNLKSEKKLAAYIHTCGIELNLCHTKVFSSSFHFADLTLT